MKKILVIFISLALCAVNTVAEELNYPKTTIDGKSYYIYTVQKSEGLYAISRKFRVTIKEIADANKLEEGLKLGQELYIPTGDIVVEAPQNSNNTIHTIEKGDTFYNISKRYGLTVQEVQDANPGVEILSIGNTLVIPSNNNQQPESTPPVVEQAVFGQPVTEQVESIPTDSEDTHYKKVGTSSVSVAVLMPFNLSTNTDNGDKFVDFYRGCLLAADSIKSNGSDIKIRAYDVGTTKESLMKVLSNNDLTNANLIIGPAYSSQIEYVAEFAKENKIKTIIPFSSNVPQIEDNKYLFQVVCPQVSLYDDVIEECLKIWKNRKILIVKPDSAGVRYNKKDFADKLVSRLDKDSIFYKYISGDRIAGETNLFKSRDSSEVVLVIPTTNNVKMSQIATHLEQIKSDKVSLLGFPEWNDILHKDIYTKPLYMFSNYRLDFANEKVINFYRQYYAKFGLPTKQNNPSYSIFGFDITFYFANAWLNSGEDFEHFLSDEDSNMLQMNFNFQKIDGGGYANHGILIQRYDKDGITDIVDSGQ